MDLIIYMTVAIIVYVFLHVFRPKNIDKWDYSKTKHIYTNIGFSALWPISLSMVLIGGVLFVILGSLALMGNAIIDVFDSFRGE